MRRIRFFHAWFASLLVVVTFALATPVAAAPPTIETIEVDTEEVDAALSEACGFTVNVRDRGFLRIITFVDRAGTTVKAIQSFHFKTTFINAATQQALTIVSGGPDRVVFNVDGSATVYSTGRGAAQDPEGNFVAFTGRRVLYISPTGELTAGPQAGQSTPLCSLLQ